MKTKRWFLGVLYFSQPCFCCRIVRYKRKATYPFPLVRQFRKHGLSQSFSLISFLHPTGGHSMGVELSRCKRDKLDVTAGPALSSAGKTVTCAGGAGAVTCVAWGLNSTTISDGVIANVSVTFSGGSAAPIGIGNSLRRLASGRCNYSYQVAAGGVISVSTSCPTCDYNQFYLLHSGNSGPPFLQSL